MTLPGARHATLEVRLESLADLFQKFDPAPIPHGNLSPDVAEYIIDCAGRASDHDDFSIRLYLPAEQVEQASRPGVAEAVRTCFRSRADAERIRRREVFRSGRQALAIGLAVLVACLSVAWLLSGGSDESAMLRLVRESLTVIGWVVVWVPAETFLYEWIPIARQRRLLARLASSDVSVEGVQATETAPVA